MQFITVRVALVTCATRRDVSSRIWVPAPIKEDPITVLRSLGITKSPLSSRSIVANFVFVSLQCWQTLYGTYVKHHFSLAHVRKVSVFKFPMWHQCPTCQNVCHVTHYSSSERPRRAPLLSQRHHAPLALLESQGHG